MLYFINDTCYFLKRYYPLLNKVYQNLKIVIKNKAEKNISIKFSSLKEQKKLINKFYQNHNSFNVLTFPYQDQTCLNNKIDYLGDISICVKVIKKDAKIYHNSFKKELCYIFIHSILHLYEYSHKIENNAKIMSKITNKILNNFKF